MNTNSAFTGSYTENPFRYQKFDLRQTGVLRGGQLFVNIDAVDNCGFCVATMKTLKALNLQDEFHSNTNCTFKKRQVFVFDLTPMQEATEKLKYTEQVGERLKLVHILPSL